MKRFWGIDCGSAEIKVVVCDKSGKILHRHKQRTLFPLQEHVKRAVAGDGSFASPTDIDVITATGYGRTHIDFVQKKLTEIKAHCLGVQHQTRDQLGADSIYTIIDIGGQDSKVIHVRAGEVQQFVINRKCAAGTGTFIEELAHRLELKLEDLPLLDQKHDQTLKLNSYCTVFAGQEVIKILMDGEKVENLIHALYESVAQRVMEMTGIQSPVVVFSGGVLFYHEPLRDLFAKRFKDKRVLLAPDAQFCGALGAALHGMKE